LKIKEGSQAGPRFGLGEIRKKGEKREAGQGQPDQQEARERGGGEQTLVAFAGTREKKEESSEGEPRYRLTNMRRPKEKGEERPDPSRGRLQTKGEEGGEGSTISCSPRKGGVRIGKKKRRIILQSRSKLF